MAKHPGFRKLHAAVAQTGAPAKKKRLREAILTDDQIAELAKLAGLGDTHAAYPGLVKAAAERGLSATPALDAARTAYTEPAHVFIVEPGRS